MPDFYLNHADLETVGTPYKHILHNMHIHISSMLKTTSSVLGW